MTEKHNKQQQLRLVDELVHGLLAQEHELGHEGYRLLQILRAAGYHDCDEIFHPTNMRWPIGYDHDKPH